VSSSAGEPTEQQNGQRHADRRAAGDTAETGIGQTLRDSTYRRIDEQKTRASETLGSVAGAVRGMTQPLRDGGQTQMADYVNKAADGIERWASQLRQQDLEDAVRGVEQFARRQPAMFLGLAFGAGLIAARFLKSSSPQRSPQHFAARQGVWSDDSTRYRPVGSSDYGSSYGPGGSTAMGPAGAVGTTPSSPFDNTTGTASGKSSLRPPRGRSADEVV
jgi:hypothetical protein